MKKIMWIFFSVAITIMFSAPAMARPDKPVPPGPPAAPAPAPAPTGDVLTGCYKKINGQLRIVNDAAQCLPSEVAVSWNIVGPAGPSGVVATSTVSGAAGAIAGGSADFVFAGPAATVTTTEAQRITGVMGAPLGTSSEDIASFIYDLCYRAAGTTDPLVSFAGTNSPAGQVSSATGGPPFTAAGSVVPGVGDWDVGFCVLNGGTADLDANDFVNGWVVITN
jgi:hypothetical protein